MSLAEPASFDPRRLFERRSGRTRPEGPPGALLERCRLAPSGPGHVVLAGSSLDLLRYFDSRVRGWALGLGASEQRFPSLLPLAILARAGYPRAFPQHLTLASQLREDRQLLDRVVKGGELAPGDLAPPSHVLAPAVCYHVLPRWEGRTLETEPVLVTARGRCFRHESPGEEPLERLREFSMRELVVLGASPEVERILREGVRWASRLVEELDLEGAIETASDPFFTGATDGRRLMQRLQPLKHELRLSLEEGGRACAVASFNDHRDFFGRRFEFRQRSGTTAHSGCVAFGLERWVLAFLCQYGPDETAWPESVRVFRARRNDW